MDRLFLLQKNVTENIAQSRGCRLKIRLALSSE
jgi:hypothetical protein